MFDLKLHVAKNWLDLGFHLLPIQPNTKWIMRGFGLHQRKIENIDEAKKYFGDNSQNNIAVICNGNDFIIDFDDYAVYTCWAKSANEKFTTSYTELSPAGAHVFLNGDVVPGLKFIDGVEVKKIALIYPSVVDGKPYEKGNSKIYSGDVDEAFFSLSKPGTPTAYLLRTNEMQKSGAAPTDQQPADRKQTPGGGDLISQIKTRFTVLEVLRRHSPASYKSLSGDGRFRACLCPFHKGKGKNGMELHRSFWIDTHRNTFGCHTCHVKGDAINLYADLHSIGTKQAINTLAAALREESHVHAK